MSAHQTGSREVVGRGSLYTLAVGAPMLSNVVVLPLVTRRLTVNDYATVAVSVSVLQVCIILCTAGLTISVTRQAILGVTGWSGARGLALAAGATAIAVGVALGALEPFWSALLVGSASDTSIAIAIACAVSGAAVAAAQSYLRARDRALQFVLLSALMSLGGPALGLIFITVRPRADVYLTGLLIVYAITACCGYLLILRDGRPTLRVAEFGQALRTGLPTLPHQMALSLMTGAMIMVASTRIDHASAARLQLMLVIGTVPTVVVTAMNNAWVPLILRAEPEHRVETLERTARHVSLLAALGTCFVALTGGWVLSFLAPASYAVAASGPLIAAFALSAPLSALYLASSHLVFVSGRTWWLALTTPLSMAVGAALAVALTPRFGLSAIAFGLVVAYLLLVSLTYLVAAHEYRERWNILRTWPALATALVGLCVGLVLPFQGLAWGFVRIAGVIAAFTVAVRLLREIYREGRAVV